MWVHCAASPQHTVYLNLLIWPTLCQWFPLRWKQYHVNYHNHLVRAVKKSFLFLSQICTCQSKTASNKPLGLRNSREEPRSSLIGFRSGVKLIFSWQFDSPLSLCCCSYTTNHYWFWCWVPNMTSKRYLWMFITVTFLGSVCDFFILKLLIDFNIILLGVFE